MNSHKKTYLYELLKSHHKTVLILILTLIGTGAVINYCVTDLGRFIGITGCSSKFYNDIPLEENYDLERLIRKTEQLGYKHQPYGDFLEIFLKDNDGSLIDLSLRRPADNPNYINSRSWNLYIITGCRITHRQVRRDVGKILTDLGIEQSALGKINVISARYHYSSFDGFPF